MQEFDKIGEDLFNKIRGRFPEVTIGDEAGTVTNEPTLARFFDFDYNGLGKVSVSIEEDQGLTVIYSKDFMEDQDEMTREAWYDFLKELRIFSKKRMMPYSVRDITKSNLNKRDYKFLAKTPEDENMNESKLYGTSRISYQKIGEARIVIKHTEGVDQESAAGRTRSIGKIYIESAEGERFIYPFKHLSGARAMARHVAEGGKPHDEFGGHIVGLSEEMSKLRKFNNYMGRSAVMAESLAGYVDAVKERISTVKKTIESLQKPKFYAETFAAYAKPMMEDVPTDVAENWIDQLTIKQFNEELADVFPYIYNLVSEASKAKSLGPDDLVDEGEQHGNSKIYDKCRDGWKKKPGATRGSKGSCIPEDAELEQGFEEMMGQFAEAASKEIFLDFSKELIDVQRTDDTEVFTAKLDGLGYRGDSEEEIDLEGIPVKVTIDAFGYVQEGEFKIVSVVGDDGTQYVLDKTDTWDIGALTDTFSNALATEDDESMEEDEQKTPLGEFILSYFDRENGAFPKGETAILTMVEKDYGEQFIEAAKEFIEQVTAKFEEIQMRTQPQQMEAGGKCHHCSGTGNKMASNEPCPDCGGTGQSTEKNEDAVDEGTWAIPDSEQAVEALAKVMAKELPLGPEGKNATNVMYNIVGDDSLYDDLFKWGDDDPTADARPIIASWVDYSLGQYDISQELQDKIRGIVKPHLTHPSIKDNKESQNMDRIRELAGLR